MPKTHIHYVCQKCGYDSLKWLGKCPDCEEWNSFVEEVVSSDAKKNHLSKQYFTEYSQPITDVLSQENPRMVIGIEEFDRVLGGGVVQGSLVLIGGEPGIGKSTIILQVMHKLSEQGKKTLFVSGEESVQQLKLRANRLSANSSNLYVLSETDLDVIIGEITRLHAEVVVIDSIQSVYHSKLESVPGSVSQIRECTAHLMMLAKTKNVPIFIIGHITKEGTIAGPKLLEHIVDTVLYFEGERHHSYRLLRAVKNRFGSTNEIGVFEMQESGLREITNPSEIFLSERADNVSGSVVVCSLEGTTPLLVELQALVTPTVYGTPQRVITGLDYKRVSLLVAVLEKRLGLHLGPNDIFVNVAGGVKLEEPSIDLGLISALVSSFQNMHINSKTVVIGEVGLGGEIRTVGRIENRIKEAQKLGFERCIIPEGNLKGLKLNGTIKVIGVKNIANALEQIFGWIKRE